jgi:hypothetical protein
VGVAEVGFGVFELVEEEAGSVAFAAVATEESVEEAGLGSEAGMAGEFDGFVDGGVVGDAVEPEELVETEAEEGAEGGLLVAAGGGFAGDEPVEGGLPADDAVDEFLAEAAVDGGERGEEGVEEGLGVVVSLFALLQDAEGNFSWFLRRHRLIMPALVGQARDLRHSGYER